MFASEGQVATVSINFVSYLIHLFGGSIEATDPATSSTARRNDSSRIGKKRGHGQWIQQHTKMFMICLFEP